MSNTHEYTLFDRAKLGRALVLSWPEFEKRFPQWSQWGSAREFLLEWALDLPEGEVDRILATKTVRATMRLADDQFHFLWAILDEKSLWAGGTEVEKGDFDYAEKLVSCAASAFVRGDLSMAGLTAVYHLHASRVGRLMGIAPKLARAVMARPPLPMFPDMPDLVPPGGDALGVTQTRLFFDFVRRAWTGGWPIDQDRRSRGEKETIRECKVVEGLVHSLKGRRLLQPCVYRWYEC